MNALITCMLMGCGEAQYYCRAHFTIEEGTGRTSACRSAGSVEELCQEIAYLGEVDGEPFFYQRYFGAGPYDSVSDCEFLGKLEATELDFTPEMVIPSD